MLGKILVPGGSVTIKKIRVLIGVPIYESISATCLNALTDFLRKVMHSPRFSCNITYNKGTYLDQNREEISDKAVEENYDYLFFIDADMVFPGKVLDKLYDRHKDVVGAVYPLRCGFYHGPCIYSYRRDERDFMQWKKWPLNKCIKVGGIGTGMLLIKVEALKKIPYPRFQYMETIKPDKQGNVRRIGEDLSFCVRCNENGIKIYGDTTMTIGHEGTKTWTYKDYQQAMLITKMKLDNLKGLTIG